MTSVKGSCRFRGSQFSHAADGSVEKFKEIDYDEISTKYTSIKFIISLAAVFGWKLHQITIKTEFLNDEVEQEVISNSLKGS
jgi:hypothetical protein